ncbi:MAG TPA: type II toxin-antitoxin system RelE/ParE family toxin [Candidatus Angelobacter sp.]|nr:type II toxin-antitoxin system RelE/ParE family toxin [Candidatus Angelobacter sp.]
MRIRWTEPAADDLTGICDYIKEHDGPERARKVALRIHEGIDQLKQFPRLGRPGRKPGTRELIFSGLPFLAIYRIRDEVIEINRILHGAQLYPDNS